MPGADTIQIVWKIVGGRKQLKMKGKLGPGIGTNFNLTQEYLYTYSLKVMGGDRNAIFKPVSYPQVGMESCP